MLELHDIVLELPDKVELELHDTVELELHDKVDLELHDKFDPQSKLGYYSVGRTIFIKKNAVHLRYY